VSVNKPRVLFLPEKYRANRRKEKKTFFFFFLTHKMFSRLIPSITPSLATISKKKENSNLSATLEHKSKSSMTLMENSSEDENKTLEN
jgi:hypothetical protein